jgi:UTP--glucose-1-phosphate uridylyltransferase
MRIRKAVIPAAGQGTRLLPLTRSQPKEMLPIGRKPVIQHVIEEIRSVDIEHILIIITQDKRSIQDYFSRNDPTPGEMFYVHQTIGSDLPYGLAYAIGLSEAFVGNEPFLVCLGDCIMRSDNADPLLERMIHAYEKHNAVATIAFEEVPLERVSRYGIARIRDIAGEEFQLDGIVEKPQRESAPSNLAVAARYIFGPEIFSCIKQTQPGLGGELQITDSIRLLLKNGHPVWGVKLREDETRYDIGGFAGYFRAFFDFALTDEDAGEEFQQHVRTWSAGDRYTASLTDREL